MSSFFLPGQSTSPNTAESSSPARRRNRRLAGSLVLATLAGGLAVTLEPVVATPPPVQALPCEDCEPPPPTTRPTTTTTAAPNTPPTASFNWSRGKRAAGANASSNLDALTAYINQPFLVNLNGCGSRPGSSPIVSHQWTINGVALSGCNPTYTIGQQGTWNATLTVTDATGRQSSTTQAVTVRDRFVVTVGDSIASGEGNPVVAQQYDWLGFVTAGPQWPNRRCHRTTTAASQQVAVSYENSHPRESVTFVNLGCSGAKILNVLQNRYGGQNYAGIEPDGTIEAPQLDQLETLKNRTGRAVDMVYLSAGANDFGFGVIANECARKSSMWSSTPQCAQLDPTVKAGDTALVGWRASYNDAPAYFHQGRYAALAGAFTQAGVSADKVVISQYPDPTKKNNGDWCDNILGDTPLALGRINRVDVIWAGGVVGVLNGDVATAAARNGWKLAPGLYGDFQTHGYCDSGKWVRNYGESGHVQGNHDGTLHPNAAGTAQYAVRIKEGAVQQGLLLP